MVLVDGIVGQVLEEIVEIFLGGRLVRFSTEASETFLTEEDLRTLDASYEDVDTQIEFESVESQRVCDVTLNDHVTLQN